jgi:hypothetical protein
MKYLSFFIILLMLINPVRGQNTFNKRIALCDYITQTGVLLTDGKELIIIANGTNINPYNYYGLSFAKLDENGNLLNKKFFFPGDFNYWFIAPNNYAYIMGDTIITTFSPGKWTVGVALFDKNTGDTLKIHTLSNYKNGEKQYLSGGKEIKLVDENKFAVLGLVREEGNTLRNGAVFIVDTNEGFQSQIEFGRQNIDDLYYSLLITERGYLVGGRFYRTLNNYTKKIVQETIVEIDHLGHEIWRYTSPETIGRLAVQDMIPEADGSIIYIGQESIQVLNGGVAEVHGRPIMCKLNPDHTKGWQTTVAYDSYFANNSVVKLLKTKTGDGYVTAGTSLNGNYDEPTDSAGYLISTGEPLKYFGFLTKVDPEGNKLWTRSYYFVNRFFGLNFINDINYAPDGGYYLLGDTGTHKEETLDTFVYAWLLKVDDEGCLIPGCGDTSDVKHPDSNEIDLLIYPNPSDDALYIRQRESELTDYQILDMSGRKMLEFSGSAHHETIIVYLGDFTQGTYVLTGKARSGKSVSRQFVKM